MSYENRFSLKLSNTMVDKPISKCVDCNITYETGKFCNECGKELSLEYIKSDATLDIIQKLRDTSEDCQYHLNKDGSEGDSGSGRDIEEDIKKFSENFPTVLFELTCYPDPGFQEPQYQRFMKDGKSYMNPAIITYADFDETKLK